ncbi:Lrp/AsnC family transcriptional regulator [Atlantibacter hermannii]|uniref:Lrp/AsnC family transcriptional regulator n=1 Tax=Enterobacteriaceae TaxID=543 RepID=UPI0028A9D691|nr:Lrp/AsnC family transcriptional regulator [Atlantibacter hermannii]MDU7391897.1 Lrp/AsnC family transcriptional regulator [Atlantibacter hermannii]
MKTPGFKLDGIDHKILNVLTRNARMTTAEIAEHVGLSPTPCGRRIRQLEEAGVIEGYTARLNPEAMGLGICVLVSVKLSFQAPEGHEQFLKATREHREITECLLVTGDSDYLLRVWVENMAALAEFIPAVLQGLPCVAETSTTLVLKHVHGAPGRP